MGYKHCLLLVHLFVVLLGRSYKLGSPQHKHHTAGAPRRNADSGLAGGVCGT